MGLDMYLHAQRSVSGYEFSKKDEQELYKTITDVVEQKGDEDSPYLTVELTAGYWRKANAIHKWFVDNVQDGKDECVPHYVARDQLVELRKLCQKVLDGSKLVDGMVHNGTQFAPVYQENYQPGKVLEDSRLARELLPAQDGFFFGSTDYDEWYVHDLKLTVDICNRALAMPDEWSFEYVSSW